jgi:hypothetical protein
MSHVAPLRAVLMALDIKPDGNGFHMLAFKVDGGRAGMMNTSVLISQDACRKLLSQLQRLRVATPNRTDLLKVWARWELALRLEQTGMLPPRITITASDLDDFGAYAQELARVALRRETRTGSS